MVEVKLWILTGVNAIILPLLIYFVSIWMKSNDREKQEYRTDIEKINKSINKMEESINGLKLSIIELKSWSVERFVGINDFHRGLSDLRDTIKDNRDSHERESTRNGYLPMK